MFKILDFEFIILNKCMINKKSKIGFIGQGYVGKNYADNFEERGFDVVRYSLEKKYIKNKDKIKECDVVFVAVPTPTTPQGHKNNLVEEVISLVGKGKVAVIKSTVIPGTTEKIQKRYKDKIILHSPEFLTEKTARQDVDNPSRNIVGWVKPAHKKYAQAVLNILPFAPFEDVVPARVSELIKYVSNVFYYIKVVYANMIYDLCQKMDIDYNLVKRAVSADPRIGPSHLQISHKKGRGAAGHCLLKDFSAFLDFYKKVLPKDKYTRQALKYFQDKNLNLLISTKKDLDIVKEVFGKIKF